MRYVIDVLNHFEENCEISFEKSITENCFNLVIANRSTDKFIEVSLGVYQLKQLNALSFKLRKELETNIKRQEKEGNNG